jgi:hypothetical protein
VTALCQVDDLTTAKQNGLRMVRYLFATESGELYMLAFFIEPLEALLNSKGTKPSQASTDNLIQIEFLASNLTFCSSLVYLDNSYIFYSSKEGDSYVLKICAERQPDPS